MPIIDKLIDYLPKIVRLEGNMVNFYQLTYL